MRAFDYIYQAIDSFRNNRLRAAMTMLGIIVGVFTVMLTLGIGAGARESIEGQIAGMGSNLIVVNSGPPPGNGAVPVYLYPSDARAILEGCPLIAAVSPQQETRLPVGYQSAQLMSNFVMGVTASYADVRRADLSKGRFIQTDDDENAAKVVVLGSSIRDYLFGPEEEIGSRILINGVDFEVIGVLETRGDSAGLGPGMSTDDRVFIPLSALQKRLLGTTDLRVIAVSVVEARSIPAAALQLRSLLEKRHPGNPFEIRTQLELMQASDSVSGIVNLLLTSLAAVSLVVGGIGIMNIMLVAVTERTAEIGVRRAIGARRSHVLKQFLIESLVMSICGGLIGVLLGAVVSTVIGLMFRWHVPILPQGILFSVGVSMLVGIVSGLYPARKASQLNIVDALRFE
jgi:ABC-type antimicrobial peptide transport system permease subunit